MMRWITCILLAMLGGSSTLARADDMIGITWSGNVFAVNSADGTESFIGNTALTQINAFTRDDDGVFWAISNDVDALFTVDPVTGEATIVATSDVGDVRGLAFHDDTLYAIVDAFIDELRIIDRATGRSTYIGRIGFDDVQAATFVGDTMYAWEVAGAGLITIDTSAGNGTDVNPNINADDVEIQTLAAGEDGNLYGGRNRLYTIDAITGQATVIPGSSMSDIRGLEFTQQFSLCADATCPGPVTLQIKDASPNNGVVVVRAFSEGSYIIPHGFACAGTALDLSANGIAIVARVFVDAEGDATLEGSLPPGACDRIYLQALDILTCAKTRVIDL